jgi:hypothetical protein
MKLNEMTQSKKEIASKALKENFELNLDFDKMGLKQTANMLTKVRGLIAETRKSADYHTRHSNPGYLKAVMMEQALASHYADLKVEQQIVLENEEVQKSQVILAAQDMIDTVQKMIEQISKLKVEELPAVVTGVKNEVGANEGDQYEQSAMQALQTLEQALTDAKGGLTQALGSITGETEGFGDEGEEEFGGEELGGMGDEGMGDMGDDLGGGDMGGDMGGELPEMPEEEEPEELGNAGRKMR